MEVHTITLDQGDLATLNVKVKLTQIRTSASIDHNLV